MRRGIILILFSTAISFFSNNLLAQNKVIDSLLGVLQISKEDSNKVNLLHDISFRFFNAGEYEQALKYENATLATAEKLGMKNKMASSYHFLGYINNAKGSYSEALKNYDAALKIRKELGTRQE
jgi:tetratricopeptide (TPR) repeat protein